MAKKTTPVNDDLDLDDISLDDLAVDTPASTPKAQAATGLNVMDFSAFEEGIEEITQESESFIKGLVYGKNGTGKTHLGGTMPGPRLFIDINEHGLKSVVGAQGDQKKRTIDTFDLFQMAYWYLKNGKHDYKSIIIDNATSLQKLMLNHIMGKEQNWDATKDLDMPSQREYGFLSQYMQRWLIDFRNLPMNVLFIAQENSMGDDDLDGNEPTVFPQLTKSVRGILGGAVDFVGQTYIKVTDVQKDGKLIPVTKFCMRIGPNPKYVTKIRLPQTCAKAAPGSIANPSFRAIDKIMRGEF